VARKLKASIRIDPVGDYARAAAGGKIVCSTWVRLAAERHLRDLNDGGGRGLYFDCDAAQHALDFFAFTRHSKGEWAGQQFKPEPFQQFIWGSLFGWKRENGLRRFRVAHLELARGNGKTTLLSAGGLYLLVGDGEPGAEIYCAATKKDQAKILFNEAERMRTASPALKKRIASFRNNMSITGTASKFEPLGADADTLDGLNVHGAFLDEFHEHKSRGLWDKLQTAMGKRRQPIIFTITTAGDDADSICWDQHEYAMNVLLQTVQDDTFFAFIACIDEEDDWKDESNWIKANPGLGNMVKIEELRDQANRAKQQLSALNSFLRYRMNRWVSGENAAIRMDDWNRCVGFSLEGRDPKKLRAEIEEKLAGRRCFIAIDLSSTEDLTSLVKLFPPEEDDPWIVIPHFWLPEKNIERKVKEKRVPYDVWVREGWIVATEGDVVDYDVIQEQLLADVQRYQVAEIPFDPWNATKFATDLQKAGIAAEVLMKFPQTLAMFAEPTKQLLEVLIPTRKIAHLANPVLAWNAANLVVYTDPNGSMRPKKKSSRGKIDGIVALLMALGRAIASTGGQTYDGPDEVFLI
jgi:phage terminase large subunit-like protein